MRQRKRKIKETKIGEFCDEKEENDYGDDDNDVNDSDDDDGNADEKEEELAEVKRTQHIIFSFWIHEYAV